jgi:hypothetical protein
MPQHTVPHVLPSTTCVGRVVSAHAHPALPHKLLRSFCEQAICMMAQDRWQRKTQYQQNTSPAHDKTPSKQPCEPVLSQHIQAPLLKPSHACPCNTRGTVVKPQELHLLHSVHKSLPPDKSTRHTQPTTPRLAASAAGEGWVHAARGCDATGCPHSCSQAQLACRMSPARRLAGPDWVDCHMQCILQAVHAVALSAQWHVTSTVEYCRLRGACKEVHECMIRPDAP